MAELNEEQLLLLNNLMYFRGSNNSTSVEEIALRAIDTAQNYDKNSVMLSGGFEGKPEQMIEIAEAILADRELCDLYVADSMHTDGVHASCFVDSAGNATVAIRGTGGTYEAWSDNVEGAYGVGTECQKEFEAFMQDVIGEYDNITITGHSKGGNLAQYATIVFGDEIDKCVSYDGQGFNDEFCEKYSAEIQANRDKIKSICAEEDYVNVLLNSVAGETVYLETTEGENAHSPYGLWEKNQGTVENGVYSDTVEQAFEMKLLDVLADELVDKVNWLPDEIEVPLVDCIGSLVGTLFAVKTGQMTWENWLEHCKKTLALNLQLSSYLVDKVVEWIEAPLKDIYNQYIDYTREKKPSKRKRARKNIHTTGNSRGFIIKHASVDGSIQNLENYGSTIEQLVNGLSSVKLNGGSFEAVNRTIVYLEKELEEHSNSLNILSSCLQNIHELYKSTEKEICASVE